MAPDAPPLAHLWPPPAALHSAADPRTDSPGCPQPWPGGRGAGPGQPQAEAPAAESHMTLAGTNLGGHITNRLPQGGRQDAQTAVPAKTQWACSGSDFSPKTAPAPAHRPPQRSPSTFAPHRVPAPPPAPAPQSPQDAQSSPYKQAPPLLSRGSGHRAERPATAQPGAAARAMGHPACGLGPHRGCGRADWVSLGSWLSWCCQSDETASPWPRHGGDWKGP